MILHKHNQSFKQMSTLCLLVLPWLGLVFLFLPQNAHAMEPIYQVLKTTDKGEGLVVKNVWTSLLNIANTFVVVVLIAVAFAQILRINVSTYGVKKILPALVFAIIAANFSFLFCRLMIDVANALLSIFFEGVKSGKGPTLDSAGGVDNFLKAFNISIGSATGMTGGDIFWFLLGQLLKMAAAIVVYILAFLFLVRNWMLYFLVALSPFCIMAMVLPQSKSLFTQWWSNFTKWVFMPIVSVFWIWLGAQWLHEAFGGKVWLVNFVFAGVCFYLAVTTPFKMGGAIMNQWGGIGKKVWGATGGAAWKATGGAGINAAKTGIVTRYDRQKLKLKNRFYQGGVPGTAGLARYMNRQQARQKMLTQQEQDVAGKRQSDAERDEYGRAYAAEYVYRAAHNGQGRINDAAYSRMIAKMRGKIGEERETYANLIPSAIQSNLARNNGIDATTGKIKSEQQMTEEIVAGTMSPEDLINVKAIVNRARQLLNSTVYRDEVRNVMGQRNAAGVVVPGLIPDANVDTWHTGDIARALYGSEVGQVVGGAVEEIRKETATAKGAGKTIEKTAMYGAKGFENLEDGNMNVNLVGISPDGKHHLQMAFDKIRGARENAVKDLMLERQPDIEQELNGAKMIIAGGKGGGLHRKSLADTLALSRELISKNQIEAFDNPSDEVRNDPRFKSETFSMVSSASKTIGGADRAKKLEELTDRVAALQAGLNHLDKLGSGGTSPEELRRVVSLMKSDTTGQAYIKDASQKLNQQNEMHARSQVSAEMAVKNIADANPTAQIGTLDSAAIRDEIAQSFKGVAEQMGHSLTQAGAVNQAAMEGVTKQILDKAKNTMFAGGAKPETSIADGDTQAQLAEALGKATAESLGEILKKQAPPVTPTTQPPAPSAPETPAPEAPKPEAPKKAE